MRILLVGDYPRDTTLGSTKVLVKLQEELRALGHTCDLVLSDAIGDFPRNAYVRQALGPVMAWAAARRAAKQNGPYDVVDVAGAEGRWIAAWRSRGNGPAVVSRSNGLEHLNYQRTLDDHDAGIAAKPWTRRLFHPLVRLTQVAAAARAADRLLVLNPVDRAFASDQEWKSEAEIDLVPHGVSSRFLQTAPCPENVRGKGILFCGSWTAVKGVTYLADAFERLTRSGEAVKLTVLGGGVPASDIYAAFSTEARHHLTVLDRVGEDAVMRAYQSHDVLAWPSTYEGFGMVVVEAMSQRLPVVATPVGCAPAVIEHERTGLLVQPRDPAALAAALARVLSDPELARRLADGGFAQVRDMSWMNTARNTLETYQRALAFRARAS